MSQSVNDVPAEAELSGLRAALAVRRRLLGTFVMLPRVEVVEMLGAAGFDVAVFDLEHAPIEIGDLPPLAAAAGSAGMFSVARLPSNDTGAIGRALDAGVDGLLVPHVSSAEEARRIVAAGRFPPAGERSLNPYVRGTSYGRADGNLREEANARVALVAMLEGEAAVDRLGEICGVSGLDGIFVGPVDLSASLGVPGEPEHPRVVGAVRDIVGRVARDGLASGMYAPTPEAAARWFDADACLVALSADIAMAVDGFAAARRATSGLAGSALVVAEGVASESERS